jgi:N4-gp56 family major capsid protein
MSKTVDLGTTFVADATGGKTQKEVVANAIGSSGFTTDDASADIINPEYWDRQVLQYLESKQTLANEAKVYDNILGQDGDSFNVTIDSAPTAATAVAETDDTTVSEVSYSQVTFTPTEYQKTFQIHDKQARRGFFDVMQNMTNKIGYAFSLNREQTAISTVEAGAGITQLGDGQQGYSATSDITSSDTMSYETIVRAVQALRENKFTPLSIHVHPKQFADLAVSQQFSFVNQAGSEETLRNGQVGRVYGITVYENDELTVQTDAGASSIDVFNAIVHATDQQGEPSFGIGRKLLPRVEMERHARGRYTDIVGVEEWDMQVLRADGLAVVETA